MTSVNTTGLARVACAALSLLAATAFPAEPAAVPGALLRQGTWDDGVGSYDVPQAFEKLPARSWPMDGWATLVIDSAAATLTVRPLAKAEARRQLKPIVDQREAVASPPAASASGPAPAAPDFEAQEQQRLPAYVRVPGLTWQARTVPLHRFRNGTPQLTPALDHRFELALDGRPFAFTLQNGLRTSDGRPYGEGTQFSLEVDGQRYDYDLGGYGWQVEIEAIGDFDGDGRPDFLFSIGGVNSSREALVLSRQARPGRNAPTAYLVAVGC